VPFIFALYGLSVAQSKTLKYYRPINIDSLLKSPIDLPKNKHFIIKSVEFSISTDKIVDMGAPGGSVKDRFFQLNKLAPNLKWKTGGCIYLYMDNSNLALECSTPEQYNKVLNLKKDSSKKLWNINELHVNKKLTVKAEMLIGRFERYDTTRDFLIRDIGVDDN
ncbi:MAG TPA: hypothetical protein VFX43_17175, partial [Chitinophagaceae bacterium]|nr:hypothetical protein [Chitinophagaceae bacterium]